MLKVLVVDDVEALRSHVKDILNEVVPDAQVLEAKTGDEGLRLFQSHQPDLIIMDIVMPNMNGIKAAQQIWGENPVQKILFWSQFHRESYVREIAKIVPDEAIHGYALKTEKDTKLSYAITSVLLQDQPYIDPIVRGVQQSLTCSDSSISDTEYGILLDIVLGLTDKVIAMRNHISVRGAQNKISAISEKLLHGVDAFLFESAGIEVYNTRARIICESFRRGIIHPDDLDPLDAELDTWIGRRFNFDKSEIIRKQ